MISLRLNTCLSVGNLNNQIIAQVNTFCQIEISLRLLTNVHREHKNYINYNGDYSTVQIQYLHIHSFCSELLICGVKTSDQQYFTLYKKSLITVVIKRSG